MSPLTPLGQLIQERQYALGPEPGVALSLRQMEDLTRDPKTRKSAVSHGQIGRWKRLGLSEHGDRAKLLAAVAHWTGSDYTIDEIRAAATAAADERPVTERSRTLEHPDLLDLDDNDRAAIFRLIRFVARKNRAIKAAAEGRVPDDLDDTVDDGDDDNDGRFTAQP